MGRTLYWATWTEVRLGRFLVFSGKLSLVGRLPGHVGGLFMRIPPKGLTRGPLVNVLGLWGWDSIQRWLVRERTRRTCWRRWRLLLVRLVSALPLVEDLGDELYLFLLSILLPFFHLARVGTEGVITSHRHHQEIIFISLREIDGGRF